VGSGYDDVLMGVGFLRALLVIVVATLAVGCGGDPRPPAHQDSPASAHRVSPAPVRQDSPTPALSTLTSVEACLQLRGSFARNRGVPDVLTLRVIADHVRDIDHTGVAAIPVALLRDDCARVGVRMPSR